MYYNIIYLVNQPIKVKKIQVIRLTTQKIYYILGLSTKLGGENMVSATEARSLTKEIAELLKTATLEEKLQIKGILIGANLASNNENQKDCQKENRGGV